MYFVKRSKNEFQRYVSFFLKILHFVFPNRYVSICRIYKVGIFTGPYLGFMVTDDDMQNANTVDFGWQGGVVAGWKFLSLKLGYEYGFCNLVKEIDTKPGDFFFRIGVRF